VKHTQVKHAAPSLERSVARAAPLDTLPPCERRAARAGLRCQARAEHAWCQGRATVGAAAGRVAWEAAVADDGLVRLGWATKAAGELGTDRHGFGFGGTGKKSHERRFEDYGRPFGKARRAALVSQPRAGPRSLRRAPARGVSPACARTPACRPGPFLCPPTSAYARRATWSAACWTPTRARWPSR